MKVSSSRVSTPNGSQARDPPGHRLALRGSRSVSAANHSAGLLPADPKNSALPVAASTTTSLGCDPVLPDKRTAQAGRYGATASVAGAVGADLPVRAETMAAISVHDDNLAATCGHDPPAERFAA